MCPGLTTTTLGPDGTPFTQWFKLGREATMKRFVLAVVLCGLVIGACREREPKLVGKGEASYLPCGGTPKCPSGVGGECALHDVLVGRPSLIDGARLVEGYLVLSDIEADDAGDTFIFDAKSGVLVASVSTPGESYRRQPDGRLSPTGECFGPIDLRVGPILWTWGKRAKGLATELAGGDGGSAADASDMTEGGVSDAAVAVVEAPFFIVPGEKAHDFGAPKADAHWTPSTAEVSAAAEAIKAYLPKMQEPRGQEMILAEWATYRAQFAGVVRHGRRRIAANLFCSAGLDDRTSLIWRHHWVVVFDGGPCYFHFEFDPKDGSIHDLVINGIG